MKLTISKEQLINGLQAVQNIVSTRTTLPILSNVLLRAEADKLELTAIAGGKLYVRLQDCIACYDLQAH